jgi:hypothetical protein
MYKLQFCLWFCRNIKFSVILREEHRLRVCEKGVLRRIFGPKKEVTGD